MTGRDRRAAARYALILLLLAAPSAHAVVSCFATVSSVSQFYNPAGPTDLVTTGSWTVTCSRASTDPGANVPFDLEAGLGLNASGQTRRVQLAGVYYDYELYRSNSTSPAQRWGSLPNRQFSGSVDLTSSTIGTSPPMSYFLRVPTGQAVGPAGIYTDVMDTTLTYNGAFTSAGSFTISINSITNCTLTVPATLTFNYTSLQAAPATPSTNFVVNCTTGLPYTMTLDGVAQPAPVNVLDDALNLSYSVSLSAGGGTGSGADQVHQIQGSMPAGQSGTCGVASCTNAAATNNTRTLTVTW